ncbi:MAG: ModE family transcriptional regulator [Burkholderiales bacterium PBB4]|nr:MAG: ModE family transcriptional regulator [Burkholderiales bacterium PBB4]
MKSTRPSLNALGYESADKRLEILRLVGTLGSISEAARQAGISYKGAWQAIHTLTNLAGGPLVDSVVGGAGGGGARLTPAGEHLLEAGRQMDAARQGVMARLSAGAGQAIASVGLRTSMRNSLPGTVQSISLGNDNEPLVRVTVLLGPDAQVASLITRESAELLGLQPGVEVLVLCKATAVAVLALAPTGPEAAGNHLPGRVHQLSKGGVQDEVVLTLQGGLQLVGFALKPHRLRAGSKVIARVDERSIVIART